MLPLVLAVVACLVAVAEPNAVIATQRETEDLINERLTALVRFPILVAILVDIRFPGCANTAVAL